MANKESGLSGLIPKGKYAPEGYVWHHVEDFNSATGHATLELVRVDAHNATKLHRGSVKQYQDYFGTGYGKK